MCLLLAAPVFAYQGGAQQSSQNDSRKTQSQVVSGEKMKVEGTILKHDANSFVMRQASGTELTVNMSPSTKIEQKKGSFLGGSKKFTADQLERGLYVEVEGRGDQSGAVAADKVRFSRDARAVALSIDSQVTPVENRMGQAEARLTESEQNAQRLSGQVDELAQVANLAKGGAAAAQKTADTAVAGVNQTNDRISSLDDYQEKTTTTVNFRVGSAVLLPDAKAELDQIAAQAKTEQGFLIEIRGFASSEGGQSLNDRLSEARAQAVVKYLAQQQDIPLRRIVLPFGYGAMQPVADNTTLEGRKQNRRVEVKILVSKGLTNPVNLTPSPTSGDAQ
jgi:outer membrane protein OmpA-like peptidoglycan-associated protein